MRCFATMPGREGTAAALARAGPARGRRARPGRGDGSRRRDAATGEGVEWEYPRLLVVAVAGVSFRPEAVSDPSFDPGRRVALVPEPENEHDPNAIGIWNEARTLQAGYVPRESA